MSGTGDSESDEARGSYRSVKAAILARIGGGDWGPGSLLPGEVDLATAFGCARATVNRALTELASEGIVERRKRAGTRVRLSPRREARLAIPIARDEVAATGAAYGYRLIARETLSAPDWVAGRMGLRPGACVLHLVACHMADGRPWQAEDRWISLSTLPQAETADFSATAPTEWLVATLPYSEVEVSFLAAEAEAATASVLSVAQGAALFCIERTTWWQGQVVTHVRLSFAPGYRMTTRY